MYRHQLLLIILIIFSTEVTNGQQKGFPKAGLSNTAIEDFLLDKLSKHKILVIPECLSHDSYDAIQLPLRLIRRWHVSNHGIKKLVMGLERETDDEQFQLVRNNEYYKLDRFATICPEGWGMNSTKQLNEDLFYSKIISKAGDQLRIFGFENSYNYYDVEHNRYLLYPQLDTLHGVIKKIPAYKSTAPMIIKYSHSRYFRDYLSFTTIKQEIEKNPDACFIIIIGNAHTLKKWSFNETDEQIIKAYNIDTSTYAHTVGYYLKNFYSPLFIQSGLDSIVKESGLFQYNPQSSDTLRYNYFFTDYYFSIPDNKINNVEEPPLVVIPSTTNLVLLAKKNFQFCGDEKDSVVAKKLIYFLTGIIPEIQKDTTTGSIACLFIDPATHQEINYSAYTDSVIAWYSDGTYIKRLKNNLADYYNRLLFEGLFRMMKKKSTDSITKNEESVFMNYLLAALTVMGTENERSMARKKLATQFGASQDFYFYYKKYYYGQYD